MYIYIVPAEHVFEYDSFDVIMKIPTTPSITQRLLVTAVSHQLQQYPQCLNILPNGVRTVYYLVYNIRTC